MTIPAQPPKGISGKSGSATPYFTRTRSPTENLGGTGGFLGLGDFRFFFVAIVTSMSLVAGHILPQSLLDRQEHFGNEVNRIGETGRRLPD